MPLNLTEEMYVRESHATVTVPNMAAHLKRGPATIYAYMKENGLSVFTQRHSHGINHPWRKANRQIEQYVLVRKEANEKRHNAK